MGANPAITFHFKESTEADLEGQARVITEADEKRSFFQTAKKLQEYINAENIEEWVEGAPLIEVVFES